MAITVIDTIIVFGAILILGFIGNYIFNKTQIPSIIWLLLFGVFIGLIFNVQRIDENLLSQVSGLFGAIAVIFILFDGGINTDLHQLFRGAPRGLLLTITGFCLSIIVTMIIVILITFSGFIDISLENSVILGVILGAIVAGTSSPIVIPLASRLRNLEDKTKMILSIESILTDPLCIVVVLAAVFMITTPNASLGDGVRSLVSTFAVGGVVGAIIGLAWLPIMHKIRKEQFSYIITLAVVFLIYSLTESWWGGAGALSCLAFGLVLGNGKKVLKMLNYHGKGFEMDEETKHFHSLTSFVIRTFFFVYLGLMVTFSEPRLIALGVVISLLLLLARLAAVFLTAIRDDALMDNKGILTAMYPRGLSAAVVAEIVISSDIPNASSYSHLIIVIIVTTVIISAIGIPIFSGKRKQKQDSTVIG